jgi:hypothetical protein
MSVKAQARRSLEPEMGDDLAGHRLFHFGLEYFFVMSFRTTMSRA